MDNRTLMNDQFAGQLSNKVEQQVRSLIGDLQMQLIVLKSMMELSQSPGREGENRPITQPTQPVPNPVPAEPVPPTGPAPKPQQDPIPTPGTPRQTARVVNGGGLRDVNLKDLGQ